MFEDSTFADSVDLSLRDIVKTPVCLIYGDSKRSVMALKVLLCKLCDENAFFIVVYDVEQP